MMTGRHPLIRMLDRGALIFLGVLAAIADVKVGGTSAPATLAAADEARG